MTEELFQLLCFHNLSHQVLPVDGEYTPAVPIPKTVLVNIGDLMQRWTADKLISTVSGNTPPNFKK